MVELSIFFAVLIAVAFPIFSAKGRGWRGLWFGLSVATLVIVVVLGSQPVLTIEQTRELAGNQNITQQQHEIMQHLDTSGLALAVGAFIGFLIAGCVYRKPIVR